MNHSKFSNISIIQINTLPPLAESLAKMLSFCSSSSLLPLPVSGWALAPSPYLLQPLGCLQRAAIKRLREQRVEENYKVQENSSTAWLSTTCSAPWGRTSCPANQTSSSFFSSSFLEILHSTQNRSTWCWCPF